MSKFLPKPPSPPPTCCKEPTVWVDYGPKLRYYYCRVCKKEVEPKGPQSVWGVLGSVEFLDEFEPWRD